MTTKFALGQLSMTPGARDTFTAEHLASCLARHARGDWGDLCADDVSANEASLRTEGRLFSVYKSGKLKLYIISEADRSVTTLLLPEEY